MRPFFRKLHRWLGLLVSLQIIAWMASGLYFAIFPIEVIRGEHLVRANPNPNLGELAGSIEPEVAVANVRNGLGEGTLEVSALALVTRSGRTWYRVEGKVGGESIARLVDARSGAVRPPLKEAQAREVAGELLTVPGELESVEWVDVAVPPGSEIRGRQLPLWRLRYSEPESLALYLDPWTGDVVARRTARWRIFDFLWMLHIMDFETRDDFNTPLLQWAAALGLLVALSGVIFWAMTSRLFRRRRAQP